MAETPEAAATATRWAQSAQKKREQLRGVVWTTHEPKNFLLRRGDHDDDLDAHYEKMLAPENIQKMADAGVKWGRLFFYKGFGLQYERPAMDLAKKTADQMHSLGMKVSLYMGGTMFIETLYRELPQAKGWEQRDEWDRFVPYGSQTWRHYACPNEPKYRDYIRKVIQVGVQEFHVDEFAFDNIMLQAEPHSCHCFRCTAAFHAMLKREYPTKEAALRRFGIPDTDWLSLHEWGSETEPDSVTVLNDPVRAAVHMSFGYQKPVPGLAPAPLGSGAFNVFTPELEFFRAYNDRYYTGVDNVADVAVIRTWATMAYSISAAYVPTTLFEQVLIQYKVPWDLLFEEQMDRIGRYGVVVLAGQECISDVQVAALLKYVRDGGTLIVTGNTGQYNQWRETRRTNPILPARSEGKGKIVYVPEVIPATKPIKTAAGNENPEPGFTSSRVVHMNPPQWVLPKNAGEIHKTVIEGLANGPSLTAEAPLTTIMEIQKRAESHEVIVHFINFETRQRVAPFAVSVKKQFPAAIQSVTLFTPEKDDPMKLQFTEASNTVHFTVPEMGTYSMVVIG